MNHLLSIEDLDREAIERIVAQAARFAEVSDREIKKVPALRGRMVLNLFYEASTRTRSSFELAAKRLSADVVNFAVNGSSVEKGESLKDTVLTLSAHKPDAIVLRTPWAGAAELVSRWCSAAIVNAGDGKHEHPTQALLDVYTLKERLRSIDGASIWIVGDVAHSRVARSNIIAFQRMGARVTVAGPPTLIPREIEAALGCEVRYTLEELASADVVYALRMQRERMSETWVPSLREYASWYQINGRRLSPRQVLMHPGPVNRGVELSGEVVDSPQAVITAQVEAGVVVRMAVLYELLSGAHVPRQRTRAPTRVMAADFLIQGPSAPAELLLADVHVLDPRTDLDTRCDVLVRDGLIAELGEPGTIEGSAGIETVAGGGKHLLPAFVDPHVHLRTPGQEHKEDLETGTRAAAAGGFGAVIAMPNTDPVIDSTPLLRSLRDAAARDARVPVGFLAAITRGLEGEELTEMAELREQGALGFTDDGRPVSSAGMLRKALQYQRLCGGVISLHEEDPTLSHGGSMREGAVSAALGVGGIPTVSESTMVARDAELAIYEQARVHFQHLSCAASVQAVARARAAGGRVSAEVTPHHLLLSDEAVRELDTRMKMNPPLAGEDDRRALVAGLRDGTIDCVATDHAPHAREEKEVPFEQAPMGTTGLETAFAALYSGLVMTGELELGMLVERMTAGAALFDLPTPSIAVGEPANLTLVDLQAEFLAGERGWESRSENCCFAGRQLRGRVLLTVAAGAVVYRQRAFSVVVA